MTAEAKKQKIVASINSRGWFPADLYLSECRELCASGRIVQDTIFTLGGNRRWVWVAAKAA